MTAMDGNLLRILDANANRAREALRVMEDYARFSLNHEGLSAELKELRHGLADALKEYLEEAILHRDVQGDVGVEIKTEAEGKRHDLNDVVVAAGKRLGEALRVIEEVLKTIDASAASRVEKLRYAAYTVEQKIARTLRPRLFDHVRLYVLITESICKRPWLQAAADAIAGGADCLQLREKSLESGDFVRRAKELVKLCRQNRVLCIINDRPDIALAAGADGVHVGQEDLPSVEARKIIGSRLILGVSTHNLDQARQAVLDGADYIGIGPIFRSETKTRDILPGLDFARQVAREIKIPALAIAGINERNVDEVLATGIKAIAVTAAVVGCDDVKGAARRLKAKLK
jgi:thiamine-phosphate pyrophosphorylase